ncbi:replicative DNA helicase [Clostridium ganghwense]|uniref:Replicative DNA helicase n=1 Tax=Clostridium ganghwense TaxID=312089 RepID=A0ABT4CK23_9CLOT|nr:replicative DNA helicase [Clostridium ganghwense]MCY6369399.1 replicative DNA helicase [Clostridium ganghwense]
MNINKIYNKEAETSIMGEIIFDNNGLLEVMDIISSSDFYHDGHKLIFHAMVKLYEQGKKIDVVALAEKLGTSLKEVGGLTYLSQLLGSALPSGNIKYYAEIIKEKSTNRELLKVINKAQNDIENEDKKSEEIVDYFENKFLNMKNVSSCDDGDITEAMIGVIDRMEERYIKGGEISGIKTGYKILDKALGGLCSEEFIILAARPSMGKTTMALNLALNAVLKSGASTAFFNLEMGKDQILKRALSNYSEIPYSLVKESKLNDDQWVEIMKAASAITDSKFSLYDKVFTINGIKRECKKLKIQKGLDVVIIDYLQLIDSGEKTQNRTIDIAKISRTLKLMAKELKVTVIALSQLSRAPEARLNHRPMLSDLRESGSLEQDADVVMFLYRDAYYNIESEEKDTIETIIAKNRNGKVGTVKLKWKAELQKIV